MLIQLPKFLIFKTQRYVYVPIILPFEKLSILCAAYVNVSLMTLAVRKEGVVCTI